MSKKVKKIIPVLISFILGIAITIVIYQIPKFKYDTNRDGKVTLNDAVKIINYYRDKRIKEDK